ncbi:MAG: RNA methyltransferase [Bacteroidales bacterium]|nr:RNA methyltransferase [Bacteroidales bacterium]
MRTETVTSASNPKIRNLLLLQEKSRARREQGLFVVEGRRELEHCIAAGYSVRTLFVCPEISGETAEGVVSQISGHPRPDKREWPAGKACGRGRSEAKAICDTIPSAVMPSVIEIPELLYRKVAYRESTEGIIAEVEYKERTLSDLHLPGNPLIMVLESVEKPGNLGAVLRSADAAGADAVLICDPLTDLYNPNLIRASIGAVFTVPTVACSSEEAIRFLKERDIQILTAQLQDSSLYYDVDMRRGTALVMGTESTGLTQIWREAADAHIRIPMLGRLDSLNVSVSASILLFEAVRQRQV